MRYATWALLLFVTGCYVTPLDIQKAEEFCEGHGGWTKAYAPMSNAIHCTDGSVVDMVSYKLIEREEKTSE